MRLHSLAETILEFQRMGRDLKVAQEVSIAAACAEIAYQSKDAIGTYKFGWTPLKPETIARKTTGDSPLLETGELRDSIKWNADEKEGYVDSDNPKLAYHEFGTSRIPPRPVLSNALWQCQPEIAKAMRKAVRMAAAFRGRDRGNCVRRCTPCIGSGMR